MVRIAGSILSRDSEVIQIVNSDGNGATVEDVTGGAVKVTLPDGGGSTPGAGAIVDLLFNEPGAPHADLVATWTIPAGATIRDVELIPVAGPWADAATMTVSDGTFALIVDSNVTQSVPYTPGTHDVLGTNFTYIQQSGDGGDGSYLAGESASNGDGSGAARNGIGFLYPDGGTVTATMSSIDTGGGGGSMLVRIRYYGAVSPVVAA